MVLLWTNNHPFREGTDYLLSDWFQYEVALPQLEAPTFHHT